MPRDSRSARANAPRGVQNTELRQTELRPLGAGELLDRAVTLFVRDFVPIVTVLAVVIVPLVILSVRNGLKMRVPQHRRVAKWTFPLWMYVSVTGVLVYFFLYQWYPPA